MCRIYMDSAMFEFDTEDHVLSKLSLRNQCLGLYLCVYCMLNLFCIFSILSITMVYRQYFISTELVHIHSLHHTLHSCQNPVHLGLGVHQAVPSFPGVNKLSTHDDLNKKIYLSNWDFWPSSSGAELALISTNPTTATRPQNF